MSNELLSQVKPAVEDAVAVKKSQFKTVQNDATGAANRSSLLNRCRAVVVANLERYPPEMFGMLSEDDWDEIIRCKHRKTTPIKGSGGLDGTGRRAPALSDKFMSSVENSCPHLSDSAVADELIWRDCVEFRFKRGGLTRPRALLLPHPRLIQQCKEYSEQFAEWRKQEDAADVQGELLLFDEDTEKQVVGATRALKDLPMNLNLLKESGIGKSLKKFVKAASARTQKSAFKRLKYPAEHSSSAARGLSSLAAEAATAKLAKEYSVLKHLDNLLQSWMDLAASKGVHIYSASNRHNNSESSNKQDGFSKDAEDLLRAESCQTWRKLFHSLKEREEQRRLNLGQKMRENRTQQNSQRPKILKVRPASKKREAMLQGAAGRSSALSSWGNSSSSATSGGSKLMALRKEVNAQAARLKPARANAGMEFGDAVAFAAVSKPSLREKQKIRQQKIQQQQARKTQSTVVALGSGKRMAVPNRSRGIQPPPAKKARGNLSQFRK